MNMDQENMPVEDKGMCDACGKQPCECKSTDDTAEEVATEGDATAETPATEANPEEATE